MKNNNYKQRVTLLTKSLLLNRSLLTGSMILFFGSLIANIFNFLFNIYMSSHLHLSDYGVLASLISLITLFSLAAESFMPTMIRFSSVFLLNKQIGKVKELFFQVVTVAGGLGMIIFLIFSVFSSFFVSFFHINNNLFFILVGATILSSFLTVVNRSLLQAQLKFLFISVVNVTGSCIKLLFGFIFVLFGMGSFGGMIAFFLSFFLPYLLTFLPLRFLFEKNEYLMEKVNAGEVFIYGIPSAIAQFGLTAFISTDVIMVKHFFPANEAGVYAVLSLIGRIIFFFSQPIGMVMFPLVVQRHAKKENFHNLFGLSVMLVLLPSLLLTLSYFIFPGFIIHIFSKDPLSQTAKPLLGYFGIFLTIYALLSILINFYLSIRKTFIFIPIIIAAILQALGIVLFHTSFFQIIMISLITSGLLLFSLLVYYVLLYFQRTGNNE